MREKRGKNTQPSEWQVFYSGNVTNIGGTFADANNLTEPGVYFLPSTNNLGGNWPELAAGFLHVFYYKSPPTGNEFNQQIFYVWSSYKVYVRYRNQHGWGSWILTGAGGLKGPYTYNLPASHTLPDTGFLQLNTVPVEIGKPVIANITKFPNMTNGDFNVQIDGQTLYIVGDPGTLVPGINSIEITYFCV